MGRAGLGWRCITCFQKNVKFEKFYAKLQKENAFSLPDSGAAIVNDVTASDNG
jgi:hypothetical protein